MIEFKLKSKIKNFTIVKFNRIQINHGCLQLRNQNYPLGSLISNLNLWNEISFNINIIKKTTKKGKKKLLFIG